MAPRPALQRLADALGILPGYHDIAGAYHATPASTAERLVLAMGFDASTEDAAAESLERVQADEHIRLLAPVCVLNRTAAMPRQLLLRSRANPSATCLWTVTIRSEQKETITLRGTGLADASGMVPVSIPPELPDGYYDVEASLVEGGVERLGRQHLILSPGLCLSAAERLSQAGGWGVWANLYSVLGSRDRGAGDLGDVHTLVEWAASRGGAFVGLNPLHALSYQDGQVCPYAPISRFYRSFLYLDLDAILEVQASPEARALLSHGVGPPGPIEENPSPWIDYPRVAARKLGVLRALYDNFCASHLAGDTSRRRAYEAYVRQEGRPLQDFATFLAIHDWLVETGRLHAGPPDWRFWPAAFHDAAGEAVTSFRDANPRRVGFHSYVQFELHRQLSELQRSAREQGMSLGVYHDLALGSAPGGSDEWMAPASFARDVELGAPPDPFAAEGQRWGVPPLIPAPLAASGYRFWIELLRRNLYVAGMLRVDHVLGLFRQFWVPRDRPCAEGAYVRFPADDLLNILALESRRSGTVIVGEDLGTVPPEVRPALRRCGILSSGVLWFERYPDGSFKRACDLPGEALCTATTHDLPPWRGLLEGREVRLRHQLGLLSDAERDAQLKQRAMERWQLEARLFDEGCLPHSPPVSDEELLTGVYAFLARSPAQLVGIGLDDLGGETEPVNLPGVSSRVFANWSRPMDRPLTEVLRSEVVARVMDQLARRSARPAGR